LGSNRGMARMNKICKQYISEVKALFPIMGKDERNYVKKLKANIESYCGDAGITSKKELYESYGLPNEVVNDYYSTTDTEYIIKRIKISKYIKAFIVAVITLAVAATSVFCAVLYKEHQMAVRQEVIFAESVVE